MKFLEFNAYKHMQNNASGKAKSDVSLILGTQGYSPVYSPSRHRLFRLLQQIWAVIRISAGTVLFVQYPSHSIGIYNFLFRKKNVKKIALLHDVESLRGLAATNKEISCLNGFDVIISHNNSMTEWLKQNGLVKPIFNIQIFDYLLDDNIKPNNIFDKFSVFFAGNLMKSTFISHLSQLRNINFFIYGAKFHGIDSISYQTNVTYEGSFPPDELIANIKGGWGLVWDGDSVDTCTGVNGEYMRYNNPHKVSMCIVSERPVIIWKQSAMANYIESRRIGISVDSLNEIYNRIKEIDEIEYCDMLRRVKAEKERIVKGANLVDALQLCENAIGINRN